MRFLILTVLASVAAFPQVRINSGGSAVGDYLSDRYYSGGIAWVAPTPVPGASQIYNSVRYGNLSYTVPLSAPGKYEVTLHFAEVNTAVSLGQRVMNLLVNDQPFLTDFDIVKEAGGILKPVDRKMTLDASSQIKITLKTVLKNAMVNAIEIVAVPSTPEPSEGDWCPGPVLTRIGDKTFIIGKNWSPTSVCFVHNGILTLHQLVNSFTVTAIPEFNQDDFLMIYIAFETTGPVVKVATKSPNSWSCTSPCVVTAPSMSVANMYPPNVVPIGAWNYRQGKLDLVAHAILGTHQIYIGGSIGLVTERNSNGWLFTLQTVPQIWSLRSEQWLVGDPPVNSFTPQCSSVLNVPYEVHRNGLLQSFTVDYTRVNGAVVFLSYVDGNGNTVVVPRPGDIVVLKYWTLSCPSGDFIRSQTLATHTILQPQQLRGK